MKVLVPPLRRLLLAVPLRGGTLFPHSSLMGQYALTRCPR
jgi:hypothetical protein